jgi:exonuclease-1
MGVKDLLRVCRDCGVVSDSLEVLKNKCVGVDGCIYLFEMLASQGEMAVLFHVLPPLCLSRYVHRYFDDLLQKFRRFSISLIILVDGMNHSLKGATAADRIRKREDKATQIAALMQTNDGLHRKSVSMLQRETVYVLEDILRYLMEWASDRGVQMLCSPMESDWQLVELERSGIAQASLSEDSDLLPIGSKLLITKLKFFIKDGIPAHECVLIDGYKFRNDCASKIIQVVGSFSSDDFISYCLFLGCDYLPRPKQQGPAKARELVKSWCALTTWQEKDKLVKSIEDQHKELDPSLMNYRSMFWKSIIYYFPH